MTVARRILLFVVLAAAGVTTYIAYRALRSILLPEVQFVLDTTLRLIGLAMLYRWLWRALNRLMGVSPRGTREDTRA